MTARDDRRRLGMAGRPQWAQKCAPRTSGAPHLQSCRRPHRARNGFASGQERIELVDSLLEREHLGGAADQQIGLEAVAAHHLDRKPPDVPYLDLAPAHERPALASCCRSRERWGRRRAAAVSSPPSTPSWGGAGGLRAKSEKRRAVISGPSLSQVPRLIRR